MDTPLEPALRRLAAIVVLGALAAMLDMTVVTVAIAHLAQAFQARIGVVQWVSTGYLLSIAMVIPLTGRLAERLGTRTLWLASLGIFLVGSVLCGSAWSIGSLIAFRVLQGIGGGMIVPLSMTILAQAAGPDQRGRIMAVAAVPAQLAPIVGPALGGLILDSASWRWIFFLNVPICLVALGLAAALLPDDGRRSQARLDLLGLLLLSPALALIVYGLSTASAGFLIGGGVLLAAFTFHAVRTRTDPLLDLRVFAHRPFAAATSLNFLSRLSIFGASILLPLYYQDVRGHSALTTGLFLAPSSLGLMLALPYVGKLTDRIGARPVVLTGIGVTTLASLAFTRVGPHTPDLLLTGALLLRGAGVAAVAVPVSAAAYHGLPTTAIPGATSTITTVQTIGASTGAAVLVAILGRPTPAAFPVAFWWVLAFTALTVFPALLLPLRRTAPTPQAEPVSPPARTP